MVPARLPMPVRAVRAVRAVCLPAVRSVAPWEAASENTLLWFQPRAVVAPCRVKRDRAPASSSSPMSICTLVHQIFSDPHLKAISTVFQGEDFRQQGWHAVCPQSRTFVIATQHSYVINIPSIGQRCCHGLARCRWHTSEPALPWVRFLRSISFWMCDSRRLSPCGMAPATASYPHRRASRSTITLTYGGPQTLRTHACMLPPPSETPPQERHIALMDYDAHKPLLRLTMVPSLLERPCTAHGDVYPVRP